MTWAGRQVRTAGTATPGIQALRELSFFNLLHISGFRRRWMDKTCVLGAPEGAGSSKILFWRAPEGAGSRKIKSLEGFRRRWMDKSCVLEAPGGGGSSKILSWRAPEGSGRED